MKLAAFSVLDYEVDIFKRLATKYGFEFDLFTCEFAEVPEGIDLSKYDMVSAISIAAIPNSIIDRLTSCKLIALRSIGYQYLDVNYCKNKGIVVTNASYDPYNVADFTIMLMLIALRKAKVSICRALVNDFSLDSMMGREVRSLTVGIIGTGKIGSIVIKQLSGFNCKILCHDLYENKNVLPYATYTTLDEIYEKCDVISLHMPLTKDNKHMINKETISKMKKGVILINTARGGLIDTEALIEAVESLHVGYAALDTIEGEDGLAHVDYGATVDNLYMKKNIMYIKQFPNVILTQHYGFFTEEAVESMVECSFKAVSAVINNQDISNKVN